MLFGLNPNESNLFDWKIAMGFLIFGLTILSKVTLIFTMESVRVMDFVEFFSTSTALVLMTIFLVAIDLQQLKLFSLIASMEELIDKSYPF